MVNSMSEKGKKDTLWIWLLLSQGFFFLLYFFFLAIGFVSLEIGEWNWQVIAFWGMLIIPPMIAFLAWRSYLKGKRRRAVWWSLGLFLSPALIFGMAFILETFGDVFRFSS